MSLRFRRAVPALLSLLSMTAVALEAAPSLAASWQTNVNYGANTPMDLYIPDEPAASPPIVVSLHYCSGNKGNAQGWLQSAADTYGFAIITPQAGGNCFDATPSRSGERADIVAMVEYVITEHGGDPDRVFAAGASSGACMTQALLAAYPEVFAGGASLAGVPAGAWTGGNAYGWSTPQRSDEAWGDIVRGAADAGFAGPWPRIQIWHGQGDTTLTYSQNWPAQVAQWTNVHGVGDGASEMVQPMGAQDTWDRTSYTDASGAVVVETNSAGGGVPHDLSGRGLWSDVVRFFELDKPAEPAPVEGMGGGGGANEPPSGDGGMGAEGSSGGTSGAGGTEDTGGGAMMGSAGSGAGGAAAPVTPDPAVSNPPMPTSGAPSDPSPTSMPTMMPTTSPPQGTADTPAMPGVTPTPTASAPATTTPTGSTTMGAGGAGAGAVGGTAEEDKSGCSVASGKRPARGPLALLGLAAMGLWSVRRRRFTRR